jgi:N6-L-threonylcarbamoyladenine synthase
MKILAIESSCDETGAAVVERLGEGVRVISNKLATSSEMHQKYGGIVPEVAAREQIKSIVPVIDECLSEAGVTIDEIDQIAVTTGPGLIGSLLVGVETARALALATGKPLIEVNHVVGHMFAAWIVDDKNVTPVLPALAVVVSGGHSEFILIEKDYKMKWLGGTKDDAAGECFDKCARAMGLGYPGGPMIEQEANKFMGDDVDFDLPLPLFNEGLLMSFSGLKTAVVRLVEHGVKKEELAWAVNQTIAKILAHKTQLAIQESGAKSLILGGGVAANKLLRSKIEEVANNNSIPFFGPEFRYCTDNAAMIGAAAAFMTPKDLDQIKANPSWELS